MEGMQKSIRKLFNASFVVAGFLFILLSIFSFISAKNNMPLLYAKIFWSLVVSFFGWRIYETQKISKYRSILFVLIAFFFFLEFKLFRFLSFADTIPPYCHIAQAATLFNFIHNQFLAITGGHWEIWGALTLGIIWLIIMFTIGQGICSWVCFFGGIDDACSNVRKKPLFKLRVSKKWRDFPIALLVFLLIMSFLQGMPIFCNWFCPLKLTTSLWDTAPTVRISQIILFSILFGGVLILLPIITKKRTFCSLICPFGALVSVCGRLSPYRVTIAKDKCTLCNKCIDVCPVFAIDESHLKKCKVSSYCNKCGKCLDICPTKAINISAVNNMEAVSFGKKIGWQIQIKDLFIFLSLLIAGVVSGSFVPLVILQIMGVQ